MKMDSGPTPPLPPQRAPSQPFPPTSPSPLVPHPLPVYDLVENRGRFSAIAVQRPAGCPETRGGRGYYMDIL